MIEGFGFVCLLLLLACSTMNEKNGNEEWKKKKIQQKSPGKADGVEGNIEEEKRTIAANNYEFASEFV